MDSLNYTKNYLTESLNAKQRLLGDERILQTISDASIAVLETYKAGNKVLIVGNGGSAADAQHIAAEFVSRFYFDRPGLPAIALTTDTSMLTAIGNDYGFEKLFSRQVQAQGNAGDILIAISTSGNSSNILKAVEEARSNEIRTIGLSGSDGVLCDNTDIGVRVPSGCTPHIQECHICIGHIICAYVEQQIFGDVG